MAILSFSAASVANLSKAPDAAGEYIGREFAGRKPSAWMNPHKVGTDTPDNRRAAVWSYLKTILDSPQRFEIESLRGQTLLCWCAPSLCHGTALALLLHLKQWHGAPCKRCGRPITSIINGFWHSPTDLLIYESAPPCPACGHYHFSHRGRFKPTDLDDFHASAQAALDYQPSLI